ncbi:uncharacterized protein LOC142336817 [Convolutriloba macropyga]|uniref:uncharacterized protein LOC142336817 n=1 Tax=Convolutriloba macropyga TaxID=536237 RepID=UPI003F51EF9B
METEEGVYTMECNPRVHSQLSTFRPNELGRTLLGAAIVGVDLTHSLALDRESLASFTPNITRGVMYFGDEVFKLLFRFKKYQKPGTSSSLSIFCHDDPDLDLSDPLPFFIKQHLQITQALFRNLVGGKPWEKLNFNLGKLVAQGE